MLPHHHKKHPVPLTSSITDFFTPESRAPDGSVQMIEQRPESRKRLYVVNQHGRKLLQLVVKDEQTQSADVRYAQIKLIPYSTRRARVYQDKPSDPSIEVIRNGVELTYHGASTGDRAPKVHLKACTGYKTLVDNSLTLPSDTLHPVPLFTLEPGHDAGKPKTEDDLISKSAHVANAGHNQPVRFDLYLAGVGFDVDAFVNSVYFFNLFSPLDYLIRAQNCPLNTDQIVAPMTLYPMGVYTLLVRRSLSHHHGRPYLQFYNNAGYYGKVMNRRTAWLGADGKMQWSTMAQDEAALNQ